MDIFNSNNILLLGTLFKMDSLNNKFMIFLVFFYIGIKYIFDAIDKIAIEVYIQKHMKKFIDIFIPNNTVSIELVTHNVPYTIGYSDKITKKKIYSLDFIALLDYVKNIDITQKREILTTQLKDTLYHHRNQEDSNNRYQFIPGCSFYDETLISKEHNIFLKMNRFKNRDDEDDSKKDLGTDLTATIYCYYQNEEDKIYKIKVLKNFLEDIRKKYEEKMVEKDKNQYIFVYDKLENIDDEIKINYSSHLNQHTKSFKNVIIEDKNKLIDYVYKFKAELNDKIIYEYEKMGIPYKAGILFWGAPGTGKTSTIKAILKETKRHGIIINLSNIESNKELETVFRNRQINGKTYEGNQICFILEDCDATKLSSIKERKEYLPTVIDCKEEKISTELKTILSNQNKGFDLSCFLNILDGLIELYGVMIIVTTNHPEKIDEALIRPGRIDFKYEFKKTNLNMLKELISLKFDIDISDLNQYHVLNKFKEYKISPAEIQSILSQYTNIDEFIHFIVEKSLK